MLRFPKLLALALLVASGGDDCHWHLSINSPHNNRGGLLIVVSTETTGQDIDPNGYLVTATTPGAMGLDSEPVAPTETKTFPVEGASDSYSVELSDVADNCAVASANPRTVSLVRGTATTTFEVSCTVRSTLGK